MFHFQTTTPEEALILSSSATMIDFNPRSRLMIVDFDYSKYSEFVVKKAINRHVFIGSQNVKYCDKENKTHLMVIQPQYEQSNTNNTTQVRYYVAAHVEE